MRYAQRYPIVSPPESGVVCRYCSYPEFILDNPAARFVGGGHGAYPSGGAANLIAHVDIPAGAQIRDIEWYIYNNNPTPQTTNGPYPSGTKLVIAVPLTSTGLG